jgi:LEA14-like dessication related protein
MRKMIAALALIAMTAACTKPKDLEFIDVGNIHVLKMGLTQSEIGLDIRLYNPNNQRVQLKDAATKVYVNSTYIGDTRMDSLISVPKRDTFSVPLVLSLNTLSGISKIAESLSDSLVNVKVEGSVKMGKAGIFKTFPVRYDKMQRVSDLTNGMIGF